MPLPNAGEEIEASDWTDVFPQGVDAWTTYTPTLTQSGAVTKTVNYAAYTKVGRKVSVSVYVTATAAGTANNIVTLSLPVTAAAAGPAAGSGFIFDASVPQMYAGTVVLATTSTASLLINGSNGSGAGATGGVFTAALANTDQVRFQFEYEAAA